MGIRRKKISDSQKNKIKELLDTQTPKEIYESYRGTRSQISLSEIYKIHREKLTESKAAAPLPLQQQTESQPAKGLQRLLISQDFIDLAAEFKRQLLLVNAKDYAVWVLPDATWLSPEEERPKEFSSVLDVYPYRGKLRVDLQVERDKNRFLLLLEGLKSKSPEFFRFEEWKELLAEFISECQKLTREIWLEAEHQTGLKMVLDFRQGHLIHVPLFVYEFALDSFGSDELPALELMPYDTYSYLLIPQGRPGFPLAVGPLQPMQVCSQVTFYLCQQYARDERIGRILSSQAEVQKQAEPFVRVLSDMLSQALP